MTNFDARFDPNVEMTLELARVAREPSAADKLRVLEALRLRLGTPGAPGAGPAGGARPAPLPPAPLPPEAALHTHAALRTHAALGQLLLVGAVTGVIGYFLGSSFNPAPVDEPPPVSVTAQEVPPPTTHATSSPRSATPEPATRSTAEPTPSGVDAAPTASSNPTAPMQRPQKKRTSAPTQRKGPQFLEAVRLVQRAQRAVDGGEPLLAMALLDELDARFPRELLNEERQATRVLALCESGQTDRAERAAQALAGQNPHSIYAARIEKSCIGWSQRAPTRR